VAAALVPVTALKPYANGPPIRSDGVGYHLWTHAVLAGDLNFARFHATHTDDALHLSDGRRGFWANKYPPGVALLRLPFMAPFVDLSLPAGTITPGEHRVALLLAAAALLAVVALTADACRRSGVSDRSSHAAVLAVTFGAGLFHYATYDASFSHVYSALGVALLLWAAVRAVNGHGGRLPVAVTALSVAGLILVRNTNGLFVVVWAAVFAAWAWRVRRPARRVWLWNAAGVAAGVALGAGAQLALNSHAHGRLALSSYGAEAFVWDRPMTASVLFSYERGLFVYYPVFALALALGLWARRTRAAAVGLAAVVIVYAGLYGYWHSWRLGAGFGHRGFVEFAPAAALVLAGGLDAGGRVARRVAAGVCGVCVLASACLMGGYWCGRIPAEGVTADLYWRSFYRVDYLVRPWVGDP